MVDLVCVGTLMLDDIQYPGRPIATETLGGSAVHAAVGMRWWTSSIGIAAHGSSAFPETSWNRLNEYGFDLHGVTNGLELPARALQVFDSEEHRDEHFIYPPDGRTGLPVRPNQLPSEYYNARAFHLLVGDVEEHLALVDAIRGRGDALILIEPYYDPIEHVPRQRLSELLSCVDAFAPDLREARAICGTDHLPTLLADLGRSGVIVIIRMGKRGAVVYDPGDRRTFETPAIPAQVVDVTGAGNAFSGGWLAGYVESGDLERAARQGAVSASFAIEQFGPPPIARIRDSEARDARLGGLTRR
jgi:sugar/nucleoside kinase (ribokinase family)